ncbi:nicotinate phosphoribosyltransferase [Anatilimnocola sp. NA78]|uniref:nicotinate phosphoribosyltransferase n=1 Tax=Anatilimnocola sp. NA78 TaxID=3415683 RepID=UPI003CE56D5E
MNDSNLRPANPSLALLTDLYQLTMSYGYWKLRRHEQRAVFHLFFRSLPFDGGYAIAAGLQPALDFIQNLRFEASDLEYLATLRGNDDAPLFEPAFLAYLGQLRFSCDIDALPEGTLAFGHEPLLRVSGPILQCQLLETALLTIVNFQTLIATKAARVVQAAGDLPVIEFGLRRAQGIDGGLSASRAAYIGGCTGTSNVLAGKMFGIPVRGTHAHSWVMSFDSELESFEQYAAALPNNCVFLVDTYNTLEGVKKAIHVGLKLRERGHELVGIRLDSGDLAYLSIEARKLLDAAGFPQAAILASNDLDEHIIESLRQQGAQISVWGVGTKMITAYDQPALGGVYKLGALQCEDGTWLPKLKVSEQMAKASIPGILQVRRFQTAGHFAGDMLFNELAAEAPGRTIVDLTDPHRHKHLPADCSTEDLLVPVLRGGQPVGQPDSLTTIRERAKQQIAKLHPTSRRLLNPHIYPVGLSAPLADERTSLLLTSRQG